MLLFHYPNMYTLVAVEVIGEELHTFITHVH